LSGKFSKEVRDMQETEDELIERLCYLINELDKEIYSMSEFGKQIYAEINSILDKLTE
jgi:hypothetical protein